MLEKQLEAKDRPAAAETNGRDKGSDKKERKEKRSHRDDKDRKRHRRCFSGFPAYTSCAAGHDNASGRSPARPAHGCRVACLLDMIAFLLYGCGLQRACTQ